MYNCNSIFCLNYETLHVFLYNCGSFFSLELLNTACIPCFAGTAIYIYIPKDHYILDLGIYTYILLEKNVGSKRETFQVATLLMYENQYR
jgi:hypothetical protein